MLILWPQADLFIVQPGPDEVGRKELINESIPIIFTDGSRLFSLIFLVRATLTMVIIVQPVLSEAEVSLTCTFCSLLNFHLSV